MVDGVDAVEVGGLRIAYQREGHGPPLLLLHGFVGDSVGTWTDQLDALSDAFTVIAWDAPGAGRSSAAPTSFGLSDYADCLAGFVAALGLTDPHMAGLSFGGAMAMALFRRRRALPKTLILAGASAGWTGSFPQPYVQQRLRAILEASNLPAAEFAATLTPSMFSTEAPPDRVAAFAANLAEFDPEGFRRDGDGPGGSRPPGRPCRTSTCRRSCCTASATCAHRWTWPRRFGQRSPAHGWSFCRASATSARLRHRTGSTPRSAPFSPSADRAC